MGDSGYEDCELGGFETYPVRSAVRVKASIVRGSAKRFTVTDLGMSLGHVWE